MSAWLYHSGIYLDQKHIRCIFFTFYLRRPILDLLLLCCDCEAPDEISAAACDNNPDRLELGHLYNKVIHYMAKLE